MDPSFYDAMERQFGVITRTQLLASGLSSNAISNRASRGHLRVVHPGVYAVGGSPDTWHRRVAAALLGAGESSAIARRSAARLWGLGFEDVDRPEILLTHHRQVRLVGVEVKRSRTVVAADLVRRSPFIITSPTRTIVDLAAVLGFGELEDILDAALRLRLTTVGKLSERTIPLVGPVPGIRNLRKLLRDRAEKAPFGSSAERRFGARLVKRFPGVVRQYEIRDGTGRLVARVDFALPNERIAIEVDGSHHAGRKQWRADLARQNRMLALGWRYVRRPTGTSEDAALFELIEGMIGGSGAHEMVAGSPKQDGVRS